jgi:hypothetical protein
MDFKNPILPVRNLHGSSTESLRNDYYNALKKLNEFLIAYRNIDFHSRDYSDLNHYKKAEQEHTQIFFMAMDIENYLTAHIESI